MSSSQTDRYSVSSSNLNLDSVYLSGENDSTVKRLLDASLNLPIKKKKIGNSVMLNIQFRCSVRLLEHFHICDML